MSITAQLSKDGKTTTVRINGNFDYNVHSDFRKAYRDTPEDMEFIIDLANTNYMDSSALGMLLLLREHAGSDKACITIMNCQNEIKKILAISNFDRLFKIS